MQLWINVVNEQVKIDVMNELVEFDHSKDQ